MMEPLKAYHIGQGKPSIAITAGIHGNEQTGMYVAELIWDRLRREQVVGRVSIYPLCNPTAARARERKAPEDGLDLNRVFPGDPNGSHTQQLASKIWRLTEGYDYVLDLHCCGLYGTTYAMHYFSKYAFADELCRALGVKNVVSSKGTRGQLYIESCELRGQKGLLVELPGGQPGGVIHEAAAREIADRVIGYFRNLGILAGEKPGPQPVRYFGCRQSIKAERAGIARPAVSPGDVVKQGDVVAYLNEQPVCSSLDGLVVGAPPLRFVFEKDDLLRIAPVL